MLIVWANGLIALLCGAIAFIEAVNAHPYPAFAYAGFGLGYVGLALTYLGAITHA